MIVLIGGEKGGTGKTTIATNLAQLRAKNGFDVLLIDTDKQASSTFWASTREENKLEPFISSVQKQGKTITKDIVELAKRYDDVIIDAGGRDNVELRASLLACHIVIIPVQASQFDLWSLSTFDDLLEETKIFNQNLQAFCVINRSSPNPSVNESNEAKELFTELKNISFSEIILKDRIAYRKAVAEGQGITELKPIDPKAKEEIEALYYFVFNTKNIPD